MQLREIPAHPLGQAVVIPLLAGGDQRQLPQVLRAHGRFLGQRGVPAHEHAPDVRPGQGQPLIFLRIGLPEQQTEVDQSLIQIFQHILRVAAGDVVVDIWILFLQTPGRLGQQAHAVGLPGADYHIAHDGLVRTSDLLFRLFHLYNLSLEFGFSLRFQFLLVHIQM